MTKSTTLSNKPYWLKILKSSIIAFVLFFLEGTLTITGWASDIAVKSLEQAAIYLVGFGLSVSALAALAAGLLMLAKKRFLVTFSRTYSVVIIIIGILVFCNIFF